MHILILHQQLSPAPSPDEQDVLIQCTAVEAALVSMGHRVSRETLSLNLAETFSRITELSPDVVFNLVESVAGTDRLMPLATLMLESAGIPFTGAGSIALLQTSGKITSKQVFCRASVPVPGWLASTDSEWNGDVPERAILKTVWEHSSYGLDDSCVHECGPQETENLLTELRRKEQATGREWFAEHFISGREFNLSLLAGSAGPVVLPPAEIQFVNFPAGKPLIVGYAAKWHDQSAEYQGTPRTFEFGSEDAILIEQLKRLARDCWHAFGLRGYARVDFRVDERGQPWVLEVNTNPCLSPDAGFAAAVAQDKMTFQDAVRRIVEDAHV